jgi:hypothetical protein
MPDERPRNAEGLCLNKPTKKHYIEALTGVDDWHPSALSKMTIDQLDSIAAAHYIVVEGDVSKSQPSPLFVREIVERSPQEQRTQLERIADEVAVMNAVRDGTIPVTKTPTKDCPRCPFWLPCQLDERGNKREVHSIMKADYVQVDPYEDNYKSA